MPFNLDLSQQIVVEFCLKDCKEKFLQASKNFRGPDGRNVTDGKKVLILSTRIAPALLGLRQALKISIYDYLSKFHQINAELFLNCYDAIIFIAVSQYKFDFGPCPQFCSFGFTLFKCQW